MNTITLGNGTYRCIFTKIFKEYDRRTLAIEKETNQYVIFERGYILALGHKNTKEERHLAFAYYRNMVDVLTTLVYK